MKGYLWVNLTHWFNWYLSDEGVVNYAINSILYIIKLRQKYNKMHEKVIHRVKMYNNAIRILLKCDLSISLFPLTKLKTKF